MFGINKKNIFSKKTQGGGGNSLPKKYYKNKNIRTAEKILKIILPNFYDYAIKKGFFLIFYIILVLKTSSIQNIMSLICFF